MSTMTNDESVVVVLNGVAKNRPSWALNAAVGWPYAKRAFVRTRIYNSFALAQSLGWPLAKFPFVRART